MDIHYIHSGTHIFFISRARKVVSNFVEFGHEEPACGMCVCVGVWCVYRSVVCVCEGVWCVYRCVVCVECEFLSLEKPFQSGHNKHNGLYMYMFQKMNLIWVNIYIWGCYPNVCWSTHFSRASTAHVTASCPSSLQRGCSVIPKHISCTMANITSEYIIL